MTFGQPWWLLLLLGVPILILAARRRHWLPFSSALLVRAAAVDRPLLARLPAGLLLTALSLFVIGLAGPRIPSHRASEQVRGRDIMTAMDISGSMARPLSGWTPPGGLRVDASSGGEVRNDRRIDAARHAFSRFVANRAELGLGDRVGLMFFDDMPRLAWPLTHELHQLGRHGARLPAGLGGPQGLGGGTNFGQKAPGPIDEAVAHFNDYGESPGRVLILITDGEEKLSRSVKDRLAGLLAGNGVRLYVVGVGSTLASPDADIAVLARESGGQVFRVENGGDLERCFATISSLEEGPINVSSYNQFAELFQYPVAAGLLVCLLWLLASVLVVVL